MSLITSLHVDALFQKQTTHTPFGGVPGCEPPSEGGRLKALLDQDDGGVWVSGARVGAQVLPARNHCFLALHFICLFADPEKHLRPTMREGEISLCYMAVSPFSCIYIYI